MANRPFPADGFLRRPEACWLTFSGGRLPARSNYVLPGRVRTTRDFIDAGKAMEISCPCGRALVIWPPLIAQHFPGAVEIVALERRLRCSTCGQKAARIRAYTPPPSPDGR